MAALFKNLIAGMGSPNQLPPRNRFGSNNGSLLGGVTPLESFPRYNPIGYKKPKDPTMFPGAIPTNGGLPFPKGGKSLLGSK